MSQIKPYERTPHYYETDKMGIVHHSNYIRWFEEARIYYLEQAGYPYEKMEENGVMIPVLSAQCEYKTAVRFGETVLIVLKIEEFNGFKLRTTYRVIGKDSGELKATGETRHFFTTLDLKPVRTKPHIPKYTRYSTTTSARIFTLCKEKHNDVQSFARQRTRPHHRTHTIQKRYTLPWLLLHRRRVYIQRHTSHGRDNHRLAA
ncbi:MAG: acyl-CoA thioesterase [Oscillospiraceae bacterium]